MTITSNYRKYSYIVAIYKLSICTSFTKKKKGGWGMMGSHLQCSCRNKVFPEFRKITIAPEVKCQNPNFPPNRRTGKYHHALQEAEGKGILCRLACFNGSTIKYICGFSLYRKVMYRAKKYNSLGLGTFSIS